VIETSAAIPTPTTVKSASPKPENRELFAPSARCLVNAVENCEVRCRHRGPAQLRAEREGRRKHLGRERIGEFGASSLLGVADVGSRVASSGRSVSSSWSIATPVDPGLLTSTGPKGPRVDRANASDARRREIEMRQLSLPCTWQRHVAVVLPSNCSVTAPASVAGAGALYAPVRVWPPLYWSSVPDRACSKPWDRQWSTTPGCRRRRTCSHP